MHNTDYCIMGLGENLCNHKLNHGSCIGSIRRLDFGLGFSLPLSRSLHVVNHICIISPEYVIRCTMHVYFDSKYIPILEFDTMKCRDDHILKR